MKLTWWHTVPFYMALINAPSIHHTANAISMGFCLGLGTALMMSYYINRWYTNER